MNQDKNSIRFDAQKRRWRIYHLGGTAWLDDYETLGEAVNRVTDAVATIWLKYHEYYHSKRS